MKSVGCIKGRTSKSSFFEFRIWILFALVLVLIFSRSFLFAKKTKKVSFGARVEVSIGVSSTTRSGIVEKIPD